MPRLFWRKEAQRDEAVDFIMTFVKEKSNGDTLIKNMTLSFL